MGFKEIHIVTRESRLRLVCITYTMYRDLYFKTNNKYFCGMNKYTMVNELESIILRHKEVKVILRPGFSSTELQFVK